MTFSPVLPLSGFAGWGVLKRTLDTQKTAFNADKAMKRDMDYFREKIGSISTAQELVSDRRLLSVALGAFGLGGDIGNKYFIRKVLEDGTLTASALANRLADKQYFAFSSAFGFGDYSIPSTKLSDFADRILNAYQDRSFETAIGDQNGDFRLALNAEREVAKLAKSSASEAVKWYTVLGTPALRSVFQTALGLPSSFASIDLDQQVSVIQAKTEKAFGSTSVSQFVDPTLLASLTKTFLIRSEVSNLGLSGTSKNINALNMLQTSQAAFRASLKG